MFLDIASQASHRTLIHDWRKNGFSAGDQMEIAVGAMGPNDRTGAIPHELTLMTWTGPVGECENAKEKAKREVGMAWTVFAHLTGLNQPELPEVMAKTSGERTAYRHNCILPGRLLLNHYRRVKPKRSLQDLGIANLESLAKDALLAAASRAHLPPSGRLKYRKPDHLSFDRTPQRLFLEIEDNNGEGDRDCYGPFNNSYDLEGSLRGLGIALAIVAYTNPDATAGWGDHGLEFPESATLRAALRSDLVRQARARSERVAAFLRSVGLPDVARDFLATYGSTQNAAS